MPRDRVWVAQSLWIRILKDQCDLDSWKMVFKRDGHIKRVGASLVRKDENIYQR